jgi:general secretion pathway protein F
VLPLPVRNSLIGRLPVFGPLWRYSSWAEFCHLLALLVESELPLPEALRLTGQGIQNSDIDRACRAMANEIEQGKTLSDAMTGRAPAVKPPRGPFDHLEERLAASAARAAQAPPRPAPPAMEDLLSAQESARTIRAAMPRSLARLLRWAENHRAISEILHMSGEMFEARARTQASFAATFMAVFSVIGVLMGIFMVVVGLMLPLITLLTRLSG